MGEGHSKRNACRLCDGKNVELVVPMPPTAIADAYVPAERLAEAQPVYPLDLYFCHDCQHVQLLDVVDPRLMFRDDYTYLSGSSPGMVKHFQEYAADVLAREKLERGSRVVDVGSNDGTFLGFFKAAGMAVLGVDPASDLARAATAKGIETLPQFLTLDLARRLRAERGPARIVTANNVFAHADDLAGAAESVRALLSPEGLFVFEVSYLVDVVDKMLLGTIFHEHLCYHSVRPLARFLARHGLELVDVRRVSMQGGSMICSAQPVGGPRPVSPQVAELAREEESRGFGRAQTFRDFSRRIDAVKDGLARVIGELESRGEVLAGYGAARGGTTLLYRLDLGRHLRFIVDDSPAKQGLFSPGHHIPIRSPDVLYSEKSGYLMILAWVHSKAIMQNHRRYLEQGGHFILSYPRVQTVSA